VKRACVDAGRKNESKVKANKIAHVKDVYTVNLKGIEMRISW
jgi:hypothetical protein